MQTDRLWNDDGRELRAWNRRGYTNKSKEKVDDKKYDGRF